MHNGCFAFPRSLVLPSCLALLFGLSITGCNRGDVPELGDVSGTVRMDGEPLAGVIVTFKPEYGRPAMAQTDAEGRYQLEYMYGTSGTKLGRNTVCFSWPTGVVGSHVIPARYAGRSELIRDIEAGNNIFDFDLESDPKDKRRRAPQAAE